MNEASREPANEPAGEPRPRRRVVRMLLIPGAVGLVVLIGLGRYEYALRVAPDRQFHAALAALANNDLDGLCAAAEALQDVDAYEPHRRLLAGVVLLKNDRLYEAIAAFGFARDHPETRVLACTLSGEALYKAKRFRDAQRMLTDAIRLDPQQTDAHRWLAATYYDIGAMNQSLRHLAVVAQQAPRDPHPHRLMGLIHKDDEEYRKAIDAYRECLKRDPNQAGKETVLLELAECQVKLQQHQEALQTLRRCPSSAQSLWLQAECQRGLGDKAAAARLADQAIGRDPDHQRAQQTLRELTEALPAGPKYPP